MAARRPGGNVRIRDGYDISRKELIQMLDKSLEEEQAVRVDERLARVVRVIVEQYDGDVTAFVESTRCLVELHRKAEATSGDGEEASAWQHV